MIKLDVTPVYGTLKTIDAVKKTVKVFGICVYKKTIPNLAVEKEKSEGYFHFVGSI